MQRFSIVLVINTADNHMDAFFCSLNEQTYISECLEVVFVDIGMDDRCQEIIHKYEKHCSCLLRYRHCPGVNIVDALKSGIATASMEWIFLLDHIIAIPAGFFENCNKLLQKGLQISLLLVSSCIKENNGLKPEHNANEVSVNSFISVEQLDIDLQQCVASLFRRDLLVALDFILALWARPGFLISAITAHYLLVNRDGKIGILIASHGFSDKLSVWREPSRRTWLTVETYDAALRHGYLELLQNAVIGRFRAPPWLQQTILMELQYYFTTDRGERSPTVTVTEPMAVVFHEIVSRIMGYIDVEIVNALSGRSVSLEVIHALLSYKKPMCCSTVSIDAYDYDQGLVKLSYYLHGTNPKESFLFDGQAIKPAYNKYRACCFFRRQLFRERIVWLPVAKAIQMAIKLDGKDVPLAFGEKLFLSFSGPSSKTSSVLLKEVFSVYPPGKGWPKSIPTGLLGLKVRIVRWLSQLEPVRRTFCKAWIMSDRENEADDNAEHLYRWVHKNHPEVNAWFLLSRSSPDWARLKKDGFRLMSNNWLSKLLILNSKYIISSQLEYVTGGLKPELYGDLMQWRFVFLQHGVIKDDLSHWFNGNAIDLMVTSSAAEYASIVDDDTPYELISKNVCCTGLPRHDSLLAQAGKTKPEDVDLVLVMPTWRGSLIDGRAQSKETPEGEAAFYESDYLKHWRMLLSSKELQSVVMNHDKRLVFMPHPSALPYLDAFNVPEYVQVLTKKDIGIQQLFCRSAVMITDYSSVAFEMAYLRRTVIYYQFDQDKFYGGEHNWREGYFDYDRDGFGPVATTQVELIDHLSRILKINAQQPIEYLQRMQAALPERDGKACKRVYESILSTQKMFL